MENTLEGLKEVLKNSELVEKYETEKGGIYLETTEDPRGRMLGDKTRKIYETTTSQILLLLDVRVTIISNGDGSEIRVIANNPEEVRRMLLSKNDDVGSSIGYAKTCGSMSVGLTVKMGQHVCLESFNNFGSIRAQIFPGINMIGRMRKDDHNKSKERELLQKLVGTYYNTEDEINVALSCLERYGGICNCKKPVGFK
jgi:hypothetical protein